MVRKFPEFSRFSLIFFQKVPFSRFSLSCTNPVKVTTDLTFIFNIFIVITLLIVTVLSCNHTLGKITRF